MIIKIDQCLFVKVIERKQLGPDFTEHGVDVIAESVTDTGLSPRRS